MNISKKIALCGISAAIGALFLSFVLIAPTGKLSLLALSSVSVMIPLSKNLKGGALLTVAAVSAIGFITGGIVVFLPYIMFFGIHPIINAYLDLTRFNNTIGYIVKLVVKLIIFNIALYAIYKFAVLTALFSIAAPYWAIALVVSAAFVPYDFIMQQLQKRIGYLMYRYLKF